MEPRPHPQMGRARSEILADISEVLHVASWKTQVDDRGDGSSGQPFAGRVRTPGSPPAAPGHRSGRRDRPDAAGRADQ